MPPKVSIVVPFYNAGEYLQRSVASALAQTERAIEVVCVDDGSTDDGAQVLERMMQADERIRLVSHGRNQGRLPARLTGIGQAQGDFLMFLDADDELAPDAVEVALAAQRRVHAHEGGQDGFDIVQFNFATRYVGYVPAETRAFNDDFARPPAEEAFGDDVVHVVFRDRKTTWSLCGKLMRSQLVKQAAEWVAREVATPLQAAEDACLFFIVASNARSYVGIPDYAGYVYNMDIGGSDAIASSLGLDQFQRDCQYADAMDAIARYSSQHRPQLALDAEVVRYEHLVALADKLLRRVDAVQRPQAFDCMLRSWPVAETVAGLADAGWCDPASALASVAQAEALQCRPCTVKTIAAYHHSFSHGGAERVCTELAGMWHEAGYRVVLFSDEPREKCVYDIPDQVAWVQLPATQQVERNTYLVRAHALAQALEQHQVDMLVHHQWWSPLLAWDLLLAKACNVPVCAYMHNIFTVMFRQGRTLECDCCRVLRHADGLVAMTQADRRFWQQFNPRVWLTDNPPTVRCSDVEPAPLAGKRVVWVGRLTSWDKQPQEAIEIFARVHASYPDAILDMVGPAPGKQELKSLEQRVRELGLEGSVHFVGAVDDVMPCYRQASVHLLTSAYDGWCLALAESKAAGVPCVMYEMPYLTLAQEGRGLFAVPQGDRDAAAAKVCELLASEELRGQMGRQAREHAGELERFDYTGLWNEIASQLGQGSAPREGFEHSDEQWDLLLQAQAAAFEAVRNEAIREIEGSRTYRAGNVIACLPRLVRRIARRGR